ncbi:MAG: hypothetical protein K2K36_01890, partial [Muribaculaceae bacterium]|nr:hypothetical protein [Muribaculaceae bacterium]
MTVYSFLVSKDKNYCRNGQFVCPFSRLYNTHLGKIANFGAMGIKTAIRQPSAKRQHHNHEENHFPGGSHPCRHRLAGAHP